MEYIRENSSFLAAHPINRSLFHAYPKYRDDETGFFPTGYSFLETDQRAFLMSLNNETNWETTTDVYTDNGATEAYKTLRTAIACLVIPIVAIFGFVGNLYNCYIFYCKWLRKFMDRLERCTTVGLIYLAISDALFCLFCIPKIFDLSPAAPQSMVYFYFTLYKKVAMNVFLWNSTWLIAVVSTQRLAYVSGHWQGKLSAKPKNVVIICSLIFLFSLVGCLPILLGTIYSINCSSEGVCYQMVLPDHPLFNATFEAVYRGFIIIVGFLIPMAMLVYSNIHLIVVLHRTRPATDRTRCCRFQVTFVIWTIVASFLVLVSPSMIVECLLATRALSSPTQRGLAILLTNLFQTIKFSSNFMLYTVFNRQFRKEAFVCLHIK